MSQEVFARIQEVRTIEATKKNITTKLITIAKVFGHEIVTHSEGIFILPSFDGYGEEDTIPQIDGDSYSSRGIGWHWDGLSNGVHLEIIIMDEEDDVKCNYKGFQVYHEVNRSLVGYVPHQEWENHMDRLYDKAMVKKHKDQTEEREERKAVSGSKRNMFLDKLKRIWGFGEKS